MAGVTCRALIDVSRHALVLVVHILLVMLVTENTLENLVVIGIHMAIRTNAPLSLMLAGIDREVLRVVIPGGLSPVNGIMAVFTRGGKSRRQVIGIGGIVIIRLMARKAIRGGAGVSTGMTGQAGLHGMGAGQRKLGLIVIERGWRPGSRGMAPGAIMTEIVHHMIRIHHRIVILIVTGVAVGRGARISAGVAGDTLQHQMRPRQRELRLIVVESCGRPRRGGVALGAIEAEVVRHMIRIGDRIVVLLMAGVAIRGSADITAAMTGDTFQC